MAPAIPSRMVITKPPGSRPGIKSFAMIPTINPKTIQPIICTPANDGAICGPSHGGVPIAEPRPEEIQMAQSDQQQLEQLKGKYQSVLSLMTQQQIQVQNVHIQDGK